MPPLQAELQADGQKPRSAGQEGGDRPWRGGAAPEREGANHKAPLLGAKPLAGLQGSRMMRKRKSISGGNGMPGQEARLQLCPRRGSLYSFPEWECEFPGTGLMS